MEADAVVAPVMLDQGPVEEGALCHWYEIPEADVRPVAESVSGEPTHPEVELIVAVPAFGVPEQAEEGVITNCT